MIRKKKAKKSGVAKKAAKKKGGTKSKKLENRSPEEVRKDISKLVTAEANELAKAVIGEGRKGQLAPVKYLFEMTHVYPKVNDGSEVTKEEDCLAKTLLDKLNVPTSPVVADEEDVMVIPAKAAVPAEAHEEEEVPVG